MIDPLDPFDENNQRSRPLGDQLALNAPTLQGYEQKLYPPANIPNVRAGVDLKGLNTKTAQFASQFSTQFPNLQITSGYRDPAYNKQVGGAQGSQHIGGNAVDVGLRGLSDQEKIDVYNWARANGAKGLGYYPRSESAHFDFRSGAPAAWGGNYSKSSLPQTPPWFQKIAQQHFAGEKPSEVATLPPNAKPSARTPEVPLPRPAPGQAPAQAAPAPTTTATAFAPEEKTPAQSLYTSSPDGPKVIANTPSSYANQWQPQRMAVTEGPDQTVMPAGVTVPLPRPRGTVQGAPPGYPTPLAQRGSGSGSAAAPTPARAPAAAPAAGGTLGDRIIAAMGPRGAGMSTYVDPDTQHQIINPGGSGESAMGLTRDIGPLSRQTPARSAPTRQPASAPPAATQPPGASPAGPARTGGSGFSGQTTPPAKVASTSPTDLKLPPDLVFNPNPMGSPNAAGYPQWKDASIVPNPKPDFPAGSFTPVPMTRMTPGGTPIAPDAAGSLAPQPPPSFRPEPPTTLQQLPLAPYNTRPEPPPPPQYPAPPTLTSQIPPGLNPFTPGAQTPPTDISKMPWWPFAAGTYPDVQPDTSSALSFNNWY